MIKNPLTVALMALATAFTPIASQAQAWPERPIKVVVAYSPGSTGDNVIRLMTDSLGKKLGQPVIVENKSGAGGNIAAAGVARAAPDGYTLLLGAANNYAANQFLYKDMGFDPVKDFDPVMALVDVPAVVFINTASSAKTFKEFVALAKAHKGKMSYGSPGIGTPPHLAAELINQEADLGLVHVPYRGSPFTVAALLSNEVQMILAGSGVGLQHVKAGKLRAIAVGAKARLPEFPDTPTLKEVGLGNIKASTWWGVAAPKGTPPAVLDKLRNAFAETLAEPKVQEGLRKLGTIPLSGADADMSALVKEDSKYWEAAIKKMGVKVD